ncbi:penicillin-binding transpeptidase domain-containing protein [Streptomyces mirabilis]|uniref:penicillin-binding transpeptidase domain-containing protein n=1 Tax=Streptomyces mirabilis TaxID=68239 RepID=UPI0033AC094D
MSPEPRVHFLGVGKPAAAYRARCPGVSLPVFTIRSSTQDQRASAFALAAGSESAYWKRLGSLTAAARKVDRDVQVGAASVEPTTGRILAVYGGPGFDHAHYSDNADTSGVPVGSTFKPIVLAAALQHGAVLRPGRSPEPITPAGKFNGDDGIKIKDQQGNYVADPKDPTGLLHQHNDTPQRWGYIPLRKAMEQSVNTPYVQLGEDVGYGNVARTAESLGLRPGSLSAPSAGFYIGTSTPSAIRMAGVYATFAADGMQATPYSVTKVTHNGSALAGFSAPAPARAVPAAVAGNVTDVLRGVIARGTGTKAQALGRTAAGKTGTTDDYRSAWFIGYTPQLATSVVLFRETRTTHSCSPWQASVASRRCSAATSPPRSGPSTCAMPSPACPTPPSPRPPPSAAAPTSPALPRPPRPRPRQAGRQDRQEDDHHCRPHTGRPGSRFQVPPPQVPLTATAAVTAGGISRSPAQ